MQRKSGANSDRCYSENMGRLQRFYPWVYSVTIAILSALRNSNIQLSEIGFIGIDDLEFATFLDPSLTTVAQPSGQFVRFAVEQLLRRTAGVAAQPGSRIVRSSCLLSTGTFQAEHSTRHCPGLTFRRKVSGLEKDFDGTLEQSRIAVLTCDLSKRAGGEVAVRWVEVRVIEQVECLQTKIQCQPPAEREEAAYFGVQINVIGPTEGVATDVSIRSKRRRWYLGER